jgi:hypothetical protein
VSLGRRGHLIVNPHVGANSEKTRARVVGRWREGLGLRILLRGCKLFRIIQFMVKERFSSYHPCAGLLH